MAEAKTVRKSDLSQVRSTVESVYIAIVLAFVLRAFMIEAFVIPTGSMANALYGEHFQLNCPACGYDYAYGLQHSSDMPTQAGTPVRPHYARCPNCGVDYADVQTAPPVLPRGGDRVLVLKYLYDFRPPHPWDVVVFKNPQNNRENYIKRLIGLPGETIEIVHGDIFVKKPGQSQFRIRRKPHYAQEAMWQVVYNNDFPPDGPIARNAGVIPPHWVPARNPDAWDLSPYGGRVFEFRGSTGPAELVFQPGRTAPPVFGPYRPHNGYNAPQAEEQNMNVASAICTDWQLQAVLMRRSDEPAEVTMIFESNGDRFAARFALDGRVQLLHQRRDQDSDDPAAWQLWDEATLEALPVGEGRVVALSTVDYRATLWVDGEPVCTSSEQQYSGDYDRAVRQATLQPRLREARLEVESLQAKLRNHDGDTAEQLQQRLADARRRRDRLSEQIEWERTPSVRLRADGPGRCQLWHLVLNRDVYYTSPVLKDTGGSGAEYEYVRRMRTPDGDLPNNWVKNDNGEYRAWGTLGNPIRLRQVDPDGRSGLDEFFCMGDNSPQSHDGRTWVAAAPSLKLYDEQGRMQYQLGTVLRYNMLGRALWVYWPAGYRLPVVGLPIIPNVGKMRLIR